MLTIAICSIKNLEVAALLLSGGFKIAIDLVSDLLIFKC